MLVSVVIPTYNAERWIIETLESVAGQTHQELEIIIVDDGSSDQTSVVAEEFLTAQPRPYRIIRQTNNGAASARNRGLHAASGDWIQFLDADDLLTRRKIELQAAYIDTQTDADVIYSDWSKLVLEGDCWKTGEIRTPFIRDEPLADILSDRSFLQLGCMLMKKTTVNGVNGFDTDHEPIEDVGLCVKIAVAGGVFVKAPSIEPIALYRDLPRSFSKWNRRKFIESCIKNAKLAGECDDAKRSSEPRVVNAIVDVYYAGARYYAGEDWGRFDELVANIEMLHPQFCPSEPWRLHVASRIVGYRRAERIADAYRRAKRFCGKAGRTSLLPGAQDGQRPRGSA